MPGGRPSTYSLEIVNELCARIVEGESLRSICRDDAMPGLSTVFKWLGEHPEFVDQYTRAKEEQAETMADEIVSIADEQDYEKIEVDGVALAVKFDSTAVARNRLRMDARKWVASKLKPKKYGDKLELAGNADSPLTVVVRKFSDG
jgi:hypothetical protein